MLGTVGAWKPTTGNTSSNTFNSQTVRGIVWETADGLGKKHARELSNLLLTSKELVEDMKVSDSLLCRNYEVMQLKTL